MLSHYADDAAVPDMQALWQNLAPSLDETDAKFRPDRGAVLHTQRGKRRWRKFRTVAAFAALLILAGSWFFAVPQTFTAPYGERLAVTLPDGSSVTLNSGSSLAYRRPFLGWNRAVKLHGEAFFDVIEASHTFTVTTFNASVSVLGTSFNVRAWEAESNPETAVVLVTGAVQFASLGSPG